MAEATTSKTTTTKTTKTSTTTTLSSTASTTSTTSSPIKLGVVTKCTLTVNVKNINVEGRSYCVIDIGSLKHPKAVETCRKLNARLPLPRNKEESDAFLKISSNWTNVDARNPKKTANKSEWVDAEGKPLGSRPVYLIGQKFYLF